MNILLPLKLAWQSLLLNKSRTFLTIFGIIIGIAAVIIVMSAGESIKGLVLGQLESFGTDVIYVETKVPNSDAASSDISRAQGVQITTLKNEDAEAISKLPNVKDYYAAVMGQSVVSYEDQNKIINFMGASADVINIDRSKLALGRAITNEEDKDLAKVTVLGSKIASDLFGNQNPINQSIKIGKNKFKVVGVLEERGAGFGLNMDEMLYLPIRTAQKLVMGIDHVMFITVRVKNPAIQDETADEIISLLREKHRIENFQDDDFAVTTMEQARQTINSVFGGITLLLVVIASISLLVGGIGIMNIMYVSVTERTFEIGLRKSVGARQLEILWQFLWEAITVTVFGGIIGIVAGIGFTYLVTIIAGQFGFTWTFKLPIFSVLIAFGFSALVGLVFGFYPAKRAAKMNPITALGYE
ncbi:ABC transporter permease [Candidatus Falkowbacteria bacterium]|nr:ABC transporter permease [Candidatus Falkowbacteria bacterium]